MRACRLDIGYRLRQPLSRGIRLKEEMRSAAGKECIRQKAILRNVAAAVRSPDRYQQRRMRQMALPRVRRAPAGTDDLRNEFVITLVDNAVCSKCIRLDRLRTGVQVLCMNPCNHIG